MLLARSKLFTEDFLVPVHTVAAGRATLPQLGKLWSGTLVMNLLGGCAIMWVVMTALPELHNEMIEAAGHFVLSPLSLESFSLAVFAGAAMTLMTRMQQGTDSVGAKMVASVAAGFLITGFELFHSIVDSLLIFGAMHTTRTVFGYLDWLGWFACTPSATNSAGWS